MASTASKLLRKLSRQASLRYRECRYGMAAASRTERSQPVLLGLSWEGCSIVANVKQTGGRRFEMIKNEAEFTLDQGDSSTVFDHLELDVHWSVNSEKLVRRVLDGLTSLTADLDQKLDIIDDMIRLKPHHVYLVVAKGILLREQGNDELALRQFLEAISRNFKDIYAQKLAEPHFYQARSSEHLKGYFCRKPFEYMEVHSKGTMTMCCPGWLPYNIGNIHDISPAQAWGSFQARLIRESIIDTSFKYCSMKNCPHLAQSPPSLPSRESCSDLLETGDSVPKLKHIKLAHDRTCNLACPSCRQDFIVADEDRSAALEKIFVSLKPVLDEVELIELAGDGDPFASSHYRDIISYVTSTRRPGECKIDLHTNANLLTPAIWSKLRLDGFVRQVFVSIDAATPETYSLVRRGGDWDRLMENLRFISKLKRFGSIDSFIIAMVIQDVNFKEIPGFIRLGHRLNCNKVYLQMLRNWGAFSASDYMGKYVAHPSNKHYQDFIGVIRSEEVQASYDNGFILGGMRGWLVPHSVAQ